MLVVSVLNEYSTLIPLHETVKDQSILYGCYSQSISMSFKDQLHMKVEH